MSKTFYFTAAGAIVALAAAVATQEGVPFTDRESLIASEVTDQQLLDWFNLENPEPVESFADRAAAVDAVFSQLEPLAETTPEAPAANNAADAAKAKADAKKAELEAKAKAKADAAEQKKKDAAAKKEAAEKAKAEKAAAREAAKAAKGTATTGVRQGSNSGKILFHTVKPTVVEEGANPVVINPRKEGSFGHVSLGIIIAAGDKGISYEDFIKAGGRSKDLAWDIDHGNARSEAAPTPVEAAAAE